MSQDPVTCFEILGKEMKPKTGLVVTLSIGIAIAAVVLNFPEFLMGSPPIQRM